MSFFRSTRKLIKNNELLRERSVTVTSSDFGDDSYSITNEDEFFESLETGLDCIVEEHQISDPIKQQSEKLQKISLQSSHVLYPEIELTVKEHTNECDTGLGSLNEDWELFHEAGEMKIYRKPLEKNGVVLDPLRAVHSVKGVTAHELCKYFWDPTPTVRLEWQKTLEKAQPVEWISDDTVVVWEVLRRVWPSATRETCYWSHIRQLSEGGKSASRPYTWIVVNQSTKSLKVPESKNVRVDLNITFHASTTLLNGKKPGSQNFSREDIQTKIQYTANVNPGGWVPVTVLREIYKREYPKFLSTFTKFVREKVQAHPILL